MNPQAPSSVTNRLESTSTIKFRPLNQAEEKQKTAIIQSYENAWTHLKLPTPGSVSATTLKQLMAEAVGDALLIKKHIEATANNNRPIRLIPGGICEYLKHLEVLPSDHLSLVRDLVHALFRTSKGYIPPVSAPDIDDRLNALLQAKGTRAARDRRDLGTIEVAFKENWAQLNDKANQIMALFDESYYPGPEYPKLLAGAITSGTDMLDQLSRFQEVLCQLPAESKFVEIGLPEVERERRAAAALVDVDLGETWKGKGKERAQRERSGEFEGYRERKEELPESVVQGEEGEVNKRKDYEGCLQRITGDISSIQEKIMTLQKNIEVLDVQEVAGRSEESKVILQDLQHRCCEFSCNLTGYLNELDEISVREEDRLKRKEQVQRIQNLIAELDSFLPKVHELAFVIVSPASRGQPPRGEKGKLREGEVQKPLSSTEAEAIPSGEEQEFEEEEVTNELAEFERQLERKIQEELDFQQMNDRFKDELEAQFRRLEPRWREMKMKIHMMVDESDSEYRLNTFLPGLKRENISLTSNKEGLSPILTITGFLGPTQNELALLRRQVVRTGNPPEDNLLLRLGQGRYGNFREKFALPLDVDINDIEANFEGGDFSVCLPKVKVLHSIQTSDNQLW